MKAEKGNTVKVHYTGTLADGTQFDSSVGREPLEFEVGAGMMIQGFDQAVEGMSVGETVKVDIAPENAYGEAREDLIHKFDKAQLPPDLNPEVGQKLAMGSEDGRQIPVTVTEITDTEIVIDANHELAGKTLTFEIELVEVS